MFDNRVGGRRIRPRALLAIALLAALAVVGTGAGFALSSGFAAAHTASSSLASPSSSVTNPSSSARAAFAVLSDHTATNAGSASVPAGAIPAATQDGIKVYVWEQAAGESLNPNAPRSPNATEGEICVGQEATSSNDIGGAACGPVAAFIAHGNVDFTGSGGSSSPMTITALVPNGVSSIELTEADGASRSVPVVNNVAVTVVQGGENALPARPAAAVSYPMPSGNIEKVMGPRQ